MTVSSTYSDSLIKDLYRNVQKVPKIRLLRPDPSIHIRLEQRSHVSSGSGKFHLIKEIYINPDNELLADFDLKEEGGLSRVYAKFGKLVYVDPREALV